jgi:hypothetical protein
MGKSVRDLLAACVFFAALSILYRAVFPVLRQKSPAHRR